MAERARRFLAGLQPPISTSNEILELAVRGDDAIATVRQRLTRRRLVEGVLHTVHTEVTQRETWTRTPGGWKLSFVDEVRDPLTVDRGPAGATDAPDDGPRASTGRWRPHDPDSPSRSASRISAADSTPTAARSADRRALRTG
jgi:hypothetical protein